MTVAQAATVVSDTSLSRPHEAPRESLREIDSLATWAGKDHVANRFQRFHLIPDEHSGVVISFRQFRDHLIGFDTNCIGNFDKFDHIETSFARLILGYE
jgi:hypothetical protein